jgi:teichuronic acid biosynthesis glycosyltransferase TuaG
MTTVSVILPAYNARTTISEAIDSVRAQTFSEWELLVVDDGSSDGTADIVEHYVAMDHRIRLFRQASPSGSPAVPRNVGIKSARGRYLAFLDSDDLWFPEKLEKQIRFMEKEGCSMSCSGYLAFMETTAQPAGYFVPPAKAGYRQMLSENTVGCLTMVVDASRFRQVVFPVCGHEDYALWLDLLRPGGEVCGMPDILAGYRLSRGSVSSNKIRVLRFFWFIYRYREGFSRVRSLLYCLRYAWNTRRKYRSGVPGAGL